MNIVILSDGATILGGAEKVALLSAVELAQRGHKVIVFAAVGPIDPMLQQVENLEVVCLDHGLTKDAKDDSDRRRRFLKRMWNSDAADRLEALLAPLPNADTVVHSHCYLAMLSAAVVDRALTSGKRVVATMHDYGIACPLRNFYHARENAICRRKPMGWSCLTTDCTGKSYASKSRAVANQFVHNVRGRIGQRLRNVIYVSDFSRKILEPFVPGCGQARVVRNPIDIDKQPRVDVSGNAACVFLGRLIPEKDPVTMARACRLAGVPAVFVGSGPEESRILAENPTARITGWATPSDVQSELRQSRCMAIPSIWYECSPLSTLEALACGLPVLTSHSNASVDDVRDGENGFVFRAGDADSMAERLEVLKNEETAERMSRNAYDSYWEAPQTVSNHVDALEAAYAELLP